MWRKSFFQCDYLHNLTCRNPTASCFIWINASALAPSSSTFIGILWHSTQGMCRFYIQCFSWPLIFQRCWYSSVMWSFGSQVISLWLFLCQCTLEQIVFCVSEFATLYCLWYLNCDHASDISCFSIEQVVRQILCINSNISIALTLVVWTYYLSLTLLPPHPSFLFFHMWHFGGVRITMRNHRNTVASTKYAGARWQIGGSVNKSR